MNIKSTAEAVCHMKLRFPVLCNWILDGFIAFLHIFCFPVASFHSSVSVRVVKFSQ